MKKLFSFLLFGLLTTQLYSTPQEAMNKWHYDLSRLDDTVYVGSKYYRPIVGGIYRKGNVCGAVFYVNEQKNTMLLICITGNQLISDNERSTYDLIEERYTANGWKLLTKAISRLFVSNLPTMIYNRTWDDNRCYELVLNDFIVLKREDNGKDVDILHPFNVKELFEKHWDRIYYINDDNTRTMEFVAFSHTGWREVPLEPEYVTHYIGE